MRHLLDSFWRAGAYCLHPKVIGLSLLPLLIGIALTLGLGWFYWEAAVAGVRTTLETWSLVDAALKWVESLVGSSFRTVLAPLIVVALAAPVIVVLSVLLVAWLMTPAIVNLVATRRFPALERKRGAGIASSIFWSLACTVLALLALVISIPLWFIPPLVLVVPPMIWGWLNYRVMAFDVLNIGLIIVGDEILSGKRAGQAPAQGHRTAGRTRAGSGLGALRGRRPRAHHRRPEACLCAATWSFQLRRHRRHARRPHAPVRSGGAGR
jgi:hypothetical protein